MCGLSIVSSAEEGAGTGDSADWRDAAQGIQRVIGAQLSFRWREIKVKSLFFFSSCSAEPA
jgi:hypothetical protein